MAALFHAHRQPAVGLNDDSITAGSSFSRRVVSLEPLDCFFLSADECRSGVVGRGGGRAYCNGVNDEHTTAPLVGLGRCFFTLGVHWNATNTRTRPTKEVFVERGWNTEEEEEEEEEDARCCERVCWGEGQLKIPLEAALAPLSDVTTEIPHLSDPWIPLSLFRVVALGAQHCGADPTIALDISILN